MGVLVILGARVEAQELLTTNISQFTTNKVNIVPDPLRNNMDVEVEFRQFIEMFWCYIHRGHITQLLGIERVRKNR